MSTNPSPVLAAALSLIFPGLGQIYAGAVRRGIAWALPTLALVLLALLAVITKFSFSSLVTTEGTLAVIALEFAFLFYHVAAMLDAYSIAQRTRRGRGLATGATAAAVLIGLLVITLILHGYPLWVTIQGNATLATLFPPGGRPGVVPSMSFGPTEPPQSIKPDATDTANPNATPTAIGTGKQTPTPGTTGAPSSPPKSFPPLQLPTTGIWNDVGLNDRLNILLIGSDAGPGRHGGRTDTMILLSIQVSTGRAAMFGFPRNMTSVPIEDASGNQQFDRVWTDPDFPGNGDPSQSLLTNLWQFAYDHPTQFYTPPDACQANDPDLAGCQGDARAFRATELAISNLAGVQIHGIIAVNLTAFRNLVDAVGGVWIDVQDPVYDDQYPVGAGDTESPRIINIPAGCNWFNGVYALAYARSRHQDSDYQRMKRQQSVLQAVRKQFDPISMLPRAGDLLGIAADNLWTTFDRDADIPLLAQIAQRVDADGIYNVRITPGQDYPSNLTPDEIKSIRSRTQHIFTQVQPDASPTPAGGGPKCPAPGQTPGPTFSTQASPKPK